MFSDDIFSTLANAFKPLSFNKKVEKRSKCKKSVGEGGKTLLTEKKSPLRKRNLSSPPITEGEGGR